MLISICSSTFRALRLSWWPSWSCRSWKVSESAEVLIFARSLGTATRMSVAYESSTRLLPRADRCLET
jgi:hypothetical protein